MTRAGGSPLLECSRVFEREPGSEPSAGWPRPLIVAAFVCAAVATLSPAWRESGWPYGHEGPVFGQRIAIYAAHLRAWDVIPLWTSADNGGFGSPMPLFYHRLFYLFAAPLYLLSGSAKLATLVALTCALTLGASGCYALTRRLGAGALASTAAGLALVGANYTVTNWLVRGAVAESTAAMLVPWTAVAVIDAARQKRLHPALGIWMGLLWHAHSVMAFYVGLLFGGGLLACMAFRRVDPILLHPRRAWPALACFAGLVVPNLLAMWVAGPQFDITRFLSWPLHPSYQFRPLAWYFWDRHWTWGHTVSGLTLQLDLPILALLAVSAAAWVSRRPRAAWPAWWPVVALPVLFGLLLQLPSSEPFYLRVPGAAFIQFPWRLLAILTPCLIALAFALADRAFDGEARLVVIACAATWALAGSGAFVPLVDPRATLDPPDLTTAHFSGYREYEPVTAPPVADLRTAIEAQWTAEGCMVSGRDLSLEQVVVAFDVTCQRPTTIPLPIFASPLHRVRVSAFSRTQTCAAVPQAPDACGALVPAGTSRVEVHLPTWRGVPGALVARLGRPG